MSTLVTVLGGTGFIGSEIVDALARAGMQVKVASRRAPRSLKGADGSVAHITADIGDESSVAAAVAGAAAVINAASLYVEKGAATFHAVHVEGAERLARLAHAAGARVFVHVSGLGVDAASSSKLVRARAQGEQAVQSAFPRSAIVRPSVVFGPGDSFLSNLEKATRIPPFVPLFGRGEMRLQPVYVGDVAAAVCRIVRADGMRAGIYELGGAQILTYRAIVQLLLCRWRRRRVLLPVPLPVWRLLTALLAVLPSPPLTRDQLVLIGQDNVVDPHSAGFATLGIAPKGLSEYVAEYPAPA